MGEVEIKFEREDLSGVVAVGTYLIDAAKRLGIRFEGDCSPQENIHFCRVEIAGGADLLSEETRLEREYFSENGRGETERLACQTKLDKPGEIVVMTEEKKASDPEEATPEEKSEQYRKEFVGMPLEKKIASLVELEAIALGETFSFIVNSPFKVFDKLMDVMAEFGLKKEEAARHATRPEEHRKASGPAGAKVDPKPKPAAKPKSHKPKDE